jgi:MFS family permease
VSVMQFGAQFVLAPWVGALCDRFDRRLVMAAGQALRALAATALTIMIAILGIEGLPGPWPIFVATFFIGVGSAVSGPAGRALVPALVPPRDLDAAVALNSVPYTVARAVGPAVGSAILLVFGPAVAFGVNALSDAALLVALLCIRPREVRHQLGGDRSVRAGLSYVFRDTRMRRLIVGVTFLAFAVDPVITLTPPLSRLLGGGDGLVGVMASAFGAGAALMILPLGRLRLRFGLERVTVAGMALIAVAMIILAISPVITLAISALAVAGLGFFASNAGLATQVQRHVPEELRGRVMALWGVAFLGTRPVAAMVNGFVADHVSTRVAIGVAGLAAAAAVATIHSLRAPTAISPEDPAVLRAEE